MTQFTFQQHKIISIVAGGWSVRGEGWDTNNLPGHVIGINDAGILAKCNSIVSMDRLWTQGRKEKLETLQRRLYVRESVIRQTWKIKDGETIPHWVRPFKCDHTSMNISEDRERLDGTNSGMCGINLAFHRARSRPTSAVFLFGFDMRRGPNGEAHWYDDYEWSAGKGTVGSKFSSWAGQFSGIKKKFESINVQLINASKWSLIDSLPRLQLDQLELAA